MGRRVVESLVEENDLMVSMRNLSYLRNNKIQSLWKISNDIKRKIKFVLQRWGDELSKVWLPFGIYVIKSNRFGKYLMI